MSTSFVSTCFKATVEDLSLAEQVKAWYDLESFGSCVQADPRSAADKRANKILATTTVHDGERYSVGMLWATDNVTLPNNYYAALVQLKSLERRLEKDPKLKSNYIKTVHDDIQKGYVIPVGEFNPDYRTSRDWYLPHHPVVNPNKPGKVRRVLNGASKFHGKSLNSCLLTGPDLLQDLLNVLLRFRQYQYAVSADIEGMFLQVGVPPSDQTCLRFLWRGDPTQNVETLQYARHIFGARDSPMCANFALQQTARDNEATYPLAAKAVQQKFYMDDYLDSVECPETALKLSQELIKMPKLGGFKLTKFISYAPMKPITIPKLELQAALLAAHLRQEVLGALIFDVPKSFMWTDSSTVLQWLASADKQPVFVANGEAEILEITTIDQWFHVPTANNPADTGTRGLLATDLSNCCWVKGPNFLRTSDWPFEPQPSAINTIKPTETCATDKLQSNSLAAVSLPNSPVIVWSKYSSYFKLIRIVAYLLRLSPRYRQFRYVNGKIEDPSGLENAKKKLLYLSQVDSFSNDLLAAKGQKSGKPRLLSYSPFIGPDNFLRSQGRLRRLQDIGYDTKHPVLLDGKHPFIKLMLIYLHQSYHHLGFDYVRAQVGHKYIILKIRATLRTIRYQCIPCRKRDAAIVNPIMADLPKERLGYLEPAFSNCGVDYFGPFFVSIRRSLEKSWVFLFRCLTTRAIHLEIVSSMDTSACVAGIERFIARQRVPNVIWSDNGTNFVGAEKELLEVTRRWNEYDPVALVSKGIRWKFNPPSAPHHGGSWERMVRSCKRVFYSILGNRRMTDETMSTTFCLVEQALNNRPLTPVSDDPNELEALTPMDFLLCRTIQALPSLVPGDEPDLRRRYTKAQAYANAIWVRWMKGYVPSFA